MTTKSKIINKQARLAVVFLACLLIFAQNALSKISEVDTLLLETEQIRLTSPEKFNENLSDLEQLVPKLNANQKCLYDYLKTYQLAYKGQYETLNSSLKQQIAQCDFPEVQARIFALMANTLVISGKFEQSLNSLDSSLKLLNDGGISQDVTTYVYNAASIVYDQIDQVELSVIYADLVYEISNAPQDLCKSRYFQYKSRINNINVPINNNEIKQVIEQCRESKMQIQSLFLQLFYLKHQVDATYSHNFDINESLLTIQSLEGDVDKTQYPNIRAFYFAILSYLFEKAGKFEQAEAAADQSLELNKSFGDTEQKVIALEVKLQVALQRANDEAAYALLKERTESEQRRFNVKQAKLAAFMKVKHDNLAKSHEIAMLNQKNRLLEMEQVIAKQNESNQKLLLLLLSMLLAFFVFWIWRAQRRQIELKKLSESDHLTKVLNRQGLEAQVNMHLKVSEEQNYIVHLAILDLDHFKKINDIHGHLTGDWVLKHVVKTCKRMLKDNMLMGRLGGEEFAIWLFDYSVKEAKDYIEQMRMAVADLDCAASGHDISITASFGLANSINSGFNITQLLRHADEALYQAKASGRNQVVVYHHDIV